MELLPWGPVFFFPVRNVFVLLLAVAKLPLYVFFHLNASHTWPVMTFQCVPEEEFWWCCTRPERAKAWIWCMGQSYWTNMSKKPQNYLAVLQNMLSYAVKMSTILQYISLILLFPRGVQYSYLFWASLSQLPRRKPSEGWHGQTRASKSLLLCANASSSFSD